VRQPQKGKPLSKATIKMLLRQYRMMHKVNWLELGRRCGVASGTAKKYIEAHLKDNKS
jgi:response regulator of citrate/malate metabolism